MLPPSLISLSRAASNSAPTAATVAASRCYFWLLDDRWFWSNGQWASVCRVKLRPVGGVWLAGPILAVAIGVDLNDESLIGRCQTSNMRQSAPIQEWKALTGGCIAVVPGSAGERSLRNPSSKRMNWRNSRYIVRYTCSMLIKLNTHAWMVVSWGNCFWDESLARKAHWTKVI